MLLKDNLVQRQHQYNSVRLILERLRKRLPEKQVVSALVEKIALEAIANVQEIALVVESHNVFTG